MNFLTNDIAAKQLSENTTVANLFAMGFKDFNEAITAIRKQYKLIHDIPVNHDGEEKKEFSKFKAFNKVLEQAKKLQTAAKALGLEMNNYDAVVKAIEKLNGKLGDYTVYNWMMELANRVSTLLQNSYFCHECKTHGVDKLQLAVAGAWGGYRQKGKHSVLYVEDFERNGIVGNDWKKLLSQNNFEYKDLVSYIRDSERMSGLTVDEYISKEEDYVKPFEPIEPAA